MKMFKSSPAPASACIAQPLGQRGADLAQRQPREALVQNHRHLHDDLGRHDRRHFHEDGPHTPLLSVSTKQEPVGPRLPTLQPLEHRLIERWAHGYTELFREHAEHLRRPLEDLIHGVALRQLSRMWCESDADTGTAA